MQTEQQPRYRLVKSYWNYSDSEYPIRNLNIDCGEVTLDEPWAIRAAQQHMRKIVVRNLGEKIAEKLHYGTAMTTDTSPPYYLYRRGGGEWIEMQRDTL
jgi:hypothetical protein